MKPFQALGENVLIVSVCVLLRVCKWCEKTFSFHVFWNAAKTKEANLFVEICELCIHSIEFWVSVINYIVQCKWFKMISHPARLK